MIILEHLTGPYMSAFWVIIAVVLLIIEIGTPGLFFFVSFAVGSSVAALCAAFDLELSIQLFVSLVISLLQFFIMRNQLVQSNDARSETNVHALVGKHAVVTTAIPADTFGVVIIGSERWRARSATYDACTVGSSVRVVAVSGNHVIVSPIHNSDNL